MTWQTLATVCEQSAKETEARLWQSVAEGLIVKRNESYNFYHDRIQQAAYSLIAQADKAAVHWQVGQLLLQHAPTEVQAARLFEIVDHLNQGIEIIDNQSERVQLTELNLQASEPKHQRPTM